MKYSKMFEDNSFASHEIGVCVVVDGKATFFIDADEMHTEENGSISLFANVESKGMPFDDEVQIASIPPGSFARLSTFHGIDHKNEIELKVIASFPLRPLPKPPKKSKFQERLEVMAKERGINPN